MTVLRAGEDRLVAESMRGLEFLATTNIAFQRNRVRIRDMIRHTDPKLIDEADQAITGSAKDPKTSRPLKKRLPPMKFDPFSKILPEIGPPSCRR